MTARPRLIRVLVGALLIAAMTLPGSGVLANGSANAHLKHIFVIMLENHSQSTVIGDPNAPYITSLAHDYGMAANYYGVTHPSLPNYVAAISGSNWFVQDDDPSVRFSNTNLVDQLEASHHTWAAYMEAMPADDKLTDAWPDLHNALYASKHNPFVLFDDIRSSSARMANVKPYTDFAADLRSGHVADFVWISPDQCNDMHGGVYTPVANHPETPCPYGSAVDDPNDASLKQKADAFVQTAVQQIMASKAWTGNSAIFILTDENDYTGNTVTGGWESAAGCCDSPIVQAGDPRVSATWPGGTYGGGLIPAVVVTTHGVRNYVSQQPYNHYSLLRTIEDAFKLGYLGNASDTNNVESMTEFFSHH